MNIDEMKMDRSYLRIGNHSDIERDDREYWANASDRERFETITYLRESFYGEEATTGRLQRVHRVFKR